MEVSFQFENLGTQTRVLMADELERDIGSDSVYFSSRLTAQGRELWTSLLRGAIETGDDESLAQSLRARGLLRGAETRRARGGGVATAKVPINAAETLAEGEFNRFYVRAVCRCALELGATVVEVYRAKDVRNPRPESVAMIGRPIDAKALLDDLRTHQGVDTALHLPAGPNSGLSVR